MQTSDQNGSNLPFAMQFATPPSQNAVLEKMAGALTTVYTTDCGPNSSPDDAPDTTNDD